MNQDKKEIIVQSAMELFHKAHRPGKVSVEEIAERAHVSPTTIYNRFGTRDRLVEEVARRLVLAIIDRSREFLRSPLPFARKLQAMISGKIALTSKADDEIIDKMVSHDPNMARFIEDVYRAEVAPIWHDFLADGKAQGYIDPDLDEEVFVVYLDILRAGFASRADMLKEWRSNLPLLEKMTRLVFYGFLRKEIDLFGGKEQV